MARPHLDKDPWLQTKVRLKIPFQHEISLVITSPHVAKCFTIDSQGTSQVIRSSYPSGPALSFALTLCLLFRLYFSSCFFPFFSGFLCLLRTLALLSRSGALFITPMRQTRPQPLAAFVRSPIRPTPPPTCRLTPAPATNTTTPHNAPPHTITSVQRRLSCVITS
jgi:hypothetical protein